MLSASVAQVGLLIVEAVFVGVVMLAAYRLRGLFGPSLLYIFLGVIFQYAALLAGGVYIRVAPLIAVSPGSVALLPAIVFLVLFVYITSDAVEARKLIYGLAGANLAVLPLALLVAVQLQSPLAINPFHLAPQLFSSQPRIITASAVVLFLDTVLVVLLYELVSRYRDSTFVRIHVTLTLALYFDSFAFVTGAFAGNPLFLDILFSQLVGKTIAALIYATLLTLYLRYFNVSEAVIAGEGRALGTTFRVLTYRQRFEELQKVIVRDSLTNVYNRGFFDEALEKNVDLAKRSERPICMLMVDVDFFKRINDDYGHTEGDLVLQLVAKGLMASVRGSDYVCRYGGEEFTILLPETDSGQAVALAERIVAFIPRACSGGWRGAGTTEVTVTIGVAAYPDEAGDAQELLNLADRHLYEGKEAGRNRVVGPVLEVGAPSSSTEPS